MHKVQRLLSPPHGIVPEIKHELKGAHDWAILDPTQAVPNRFAIGRRKNCYVSGLIFTPAGVTCQVMKSAMVFAIEVEVQVIPPMFLFSSSSAWSQ